MLLRRLQLNVDNRFIIPILVMGEVLLTPLIRGHRIVGPIYRRGINSIIRD